MQKETPPNIQRAVTFFAQAGLSRLLTRLREKYIDVGQVGGQIILQDSMQSERREIASFLGKPPYRDTNIKVRLIDIDNALQHSGFACTLPDLLRAFFPDQPLVTRPEQRTMHATHQANFRTALLSIASTLPEGGRGRLWLEQGQHGQEWLFSRYKNTTKEEQGQQLALVRYIARVLDQLPGPDTPERLAIFAQRTSGNPHILDADRATGRLLLLALSDLAKDQEQDSVTSGTFLQDRAQELRLYNQAGLLIDTISSNVAVFNLAGAYSLDGIPDPLLTAAGQRVLLLPLRQIQAWQSVLPAKADIYLFENPQVFEEVIAHIQPNTPSPTLICTSGWPSVAALTLLDLLIAQSPDNHFHYSGDFDVKGLQIAAYLMARYPGRCIPWHFDTAAYLQALQSGGVSARAHELAMLQGLPDVFASLVAVIQERGMWGYQEGIVCLLVEDVNR
jgi:uncharacterized protein (TIGR02679 family)